MRTALLATCLALASVAFACGDAGSTTATSRRHNVDPGAPDDHDSSDPGSQDNGAPGDPNATKPPDAPTDPGKPSGSFDLALDNATPTGDLGAKTDIKVTLTPKAGFTGAATLTVSGLPTGVTGSFVPATINVSGAAPMTSTLSISVPVTTPTTGAGTPAAVVVTATAGQTVATANANFKVNAKLKLEIPLNVDALRQANVRYVDDWGASLVGGTAIGSAKSPLLTQTGNPIAVTVYNADSKSHIVHGQNGFAHGDTANAIPAMSQELQNGAPRVRNLAVGVNAQGYPHEGTSGVGASFQIQVQASP
jgi:hypothetical protein